MPLVSGLHASTAVSRQVVTKRALLTVGPSATVYTAALWSLNLPELVFWFMPMDAAAVNIEVTPQFAWRNTPAGLVASSPEYVPIESTYALGLTGTVTRKTFLHPARLIRAQLYNPGGAAGQVAVYFAASG
jgi:hypothetical protein